MKDNPNSRDNFIESTEQRNLKRDIESLSVENQHPL